MAEERKFRLVSYDEDEHGNRTVEDIREFSELEDPKAARRKFMREIGRLYDERQAGLPYRDLVAINVEWMQ